MRTVTHEWGCRRIYAHVKNLPPEAALWREQGSLTFPELMHEWMVTLIQFGAGKKVRAPLMVREPEKEKVIRTMDPEEIKSALSGVFG